MVRADPLAARHPRMGRPPRLSPETILDAAWELIRDGNRVEFSMRDLGELLAVDPAAIYRHFPSKQDLLRALVDRLLDHVAVEPDLSPWREVLERCCVGLRRSLSVAPSLLEAIGSAPPRLDNEIRLADTMLGALRAAGLPPIHAASAYHALIELTLGSVVVDGALSVRTPSERERLYADWRADYARLDPTTHPHAVEVADQLYRGSADDRFAAALGLMIAGIAGLPDI